MNRHNKISILIVNYNSSAFIENSLFALKRLTMNDFRVFILDNNSKYCDYLKLKLIVKKYSGEIEIDLERKKHNLRGSLAHGTALNELIKKVDTPYFSILDADATWLKKNWDEILISRFTKKIKAFGNQAPLVKPQDFPLMFAILLETETFKKLAVDFRPNDLMKNQDTGWEMREKYLAAGYTGRNIEFKNIRTYKNGPFKSIPGVDEFYLENNYGEIFASHFGRGSNPFAKQKIKCNNKFLSILLIPLNYYFWRRDKKNWIKSCKDIVNNQN